MNQSAHMRRISLPVLALVATLLVAVPQPAAALSTYLNVDQLDVSTFVDAGTAVSQRSFDPAGTDAVVLATDGNFPDGLTASAVAGAVGGPVLFTGILELPAATAEEIDRLLDPGDTVYLMGGTVAISPAVEDQLAEDYTVVRLAGDTRLETAVEAAELVGVDEESPRVIIARAFGPDGANTPSDRTTGWVDAISCGAFAAATSTPILLTETDVLSGTTEDALRDLDPDDAILCGGTAAISASTATAIRSLGIDVERVEGPTRVETAIDAARTLFGATTAAGGTFAVVPGYGESFGYGLAVAPLGLPILLVGQSEPTLCTDGSQPSRETLCYLRTAGDETAQLVVVGNQEVIADPVVDALGEAAGGRDIADLPLLGAPANVAATDDINDGGTQATVTWNAVADPDEILAGYQVFVDGEPASDVVTGTTAIAQGLTPEVEASITVAAIDVGDREGAMSTPALVTATDEVPEPIANLQAAPGDASVAVSWEIGPIDTAQYTLERAVDEEATIPIILPGGCTSFEEVAAITDRTTTTFTDTTVENGTGYCYRITVTDAADQTSGASTTEAVVPEPGVPTATILSPTVRTTTNALGQEQADPDTVYAGVPLVIEYTLRDTDTPAGQLRVQWEVSTDGGTTYGPIGAGDPIAPTFTDEASGSATFTVPACTTGPGVPSAGCVEDVDTPAGGPALRYRVTVSDPEERATRTTTGSLEQDRAPGPVVGLAAVPGNGLITASWDRLAYTLGDANLRYRVRVADSGEDGPDVDPSVCEDVAFAGAGQTVPQPAASQTRISSVLSGLVNGSGANDPFYCVEVTAVRTGPDRVGPPVTSGANPDANLPGAIAFVRPQQGTALDRGTAETLTYSIDLPDGVTGTRVDFAYCVNFDQAQNRCEDAGGAAIDFTPITSGLTPSTPSAAEGTRSASWQVPGSADINQADGQTGALRAILQTSGGPANSALVSGIIFR